MEARAGHVRRTRTEARVGVGVAGVHGRAGGGHRCGAAGRLGRVLFVAAKVWCHRSLLSTPISSVGRVEIYAFSAVFWTSNGPTKGSIWLFLLIHRDSKETAVDDGGEVNGS